MAKALKEFGISVDYVLNEDGDAKKDHIIVTMKKRVTEGDDEVVGTRTYSPSTWGETCQRRNVLYGASKIVQDRTSSLSGDESRLDVMDEVVARLAEDQWEKERESTGRSVRIEVEALADIKGVGVGAIQKALRNYDAEAREKILSSDVVKAKVAELEARAAESGEDEIPLDDLLDAA